MRENRQVKDLPAKLKKVVGLLAFLILTAAICPPLYGSPPLASPDHTPPKQSTPATAPLPLSPHETNLTQQSPRVRIEPVQSTVTAGETFTVSVMIDDASDLECFQFELLYNPIVVTVDTVTVGDFLGSTGRTVIPVGPVIDNDAGSTIFAAISLGPAPEADGTGELAVIRLTAQDVGESPLELSRVDIEAPITVEGGSVVVNPALTPVPTRTPTATPTIMPTPIPIFTPVAGGWVIETVDSEGYVGGYSSLALDEDEYPHISYLGDGLMCAYRGVSGWYIETIDRVFSGHTSLALDEDEYPHISYIDKTNQDLKYAFQDASGWHIQTVDSEGWVGCDTSLALDEAGYPHISYCGHALKYAYQDASGWHIETVDSAVNVVKPSLALDEDGYPHISYTVESGLDDVYLSYAYQDASGWHIQTVDSGGWVGFHSSLALDGSGYPHISYYYWGTPIFSDVQALKYAYEDSAGWHKETVDSVDLVDDTSLALDEDGYPHISYTESSSVEDNWLSYAYRDAHGWHVQTVDNEGYIHWDTSLALDESGYPHISYQSSGCLNYAYYTKSPSTPTPTPTATNTATPTPTPDPNWTPTPTPEPVIAVSPGEAPGGNEFVFTGSGFTPNGLLEDLCAKPDQAYESFGYFRADSSGVFVRRHNLVGESPEGTYTYLAFDFTKLSWATVEFEMIRYRVYLPVVFQ